MVEWPGEEVILIPSEAWSLYVSAFRVSARLRHLIEFKRFQVLGDLHGLRYAELGTYRNCGRKTLDELRELVQAIHASTPRSAGPPLLSVSTSLAAGIIARRFYVPEMAHQLSVAELPLSGRLESVLGRLGVQRLGDVHGLQVASFRAVPGCGAKTLTELVHLLERAGSGEFAVEADVGWDPAGLVRGLDRLIAELPGRNVEILRMRLGDITGEIPSLARVGMRFGLSRDRIRQITESGIDRIRRRGGQRLRDHLGQVARACQEQQRPLTRVLLQDWLETASGEVRFTPEFYVRLMAQLDPALPFTGSSRGKSA